MQSLRRPRDDMGELSLHQEMMQGFLEWVEGLRTLEPTSERPGPAPGGLTDDISQDRRRVPEIPPGRRNIRGDEFDAQL